MFPQNNRSFAVEWTMRWQAENLLLPLFMTLNMSHFDFASCNFTLKKMLRVDSGNGGLSAEETGRVFYGRHAGILRSYTLECNYNTGKVGVLCRSAIGGVELRVSTLPMPRRCASLATECLHPCHGQISVRHRPKRLG